MLRRFFRSLLALIFVSVLLLLAQGCSKSSNPTAPPGPPPANTVFIVDNSFNPASLTVDSGVTVTWKNNGASTHTVTSNTGLFNSGNINPGGTFSRAFTTKGTFGYHCTLHAGMAGTIIVQ